MAFIDKILGYFKKEIQLNKEYYAEIKEKQQEPQQEKTIEKQKQPIEPASSALSTDKKVTAIPLNAPKDYSAYTVYFTNGHLSKIDPYPDGGYYENRDIANNADFIVSDGVKYDLTSVKSIHSIAIPSYSYDVDGGIGTTGYLEYILRIHANIYWEICEYKLAIACLEKATQLMRYSTMGWPPKEFFRIVNTLNDLGKFKSAKQWEEWIQKNVRGAASATSSSVEEQISESTKNSFQTRIASCKELNTDLIEIEDMGACCEKCAMYRKRVYSLSGKNKLFPKFPRDYHWGCGLNGWPFIYGTSEPTFDCDNVIAYSNRPYVDDRTEEEKRNYIERMARLNKEPPIIREPELNRIIYYRLKQLIPGEMPKSLSGFSRMRNANTKNYQALVKKAEAAGFVFPQSLDDVAKWPENQ